MKKTFAVLLAAAMLLGLYPAAAALPAQEEAPKLGQNPVEEIIAAMTLREKASLLSGSYKEEEDTPDENGRKTAMPSGAGTVGGYTQGISRYGIPSISLTDGPAGINMQPVTSQGQTAYPTAYPSSIALASSWDRDLMEQVGESLGDQMIAFQKDILLAPMLNHLRNPLFGRTFECYSEDPLVTGVLAAAFVNGVQKKGIGVTAKTLIANDQETNRLDVNSIVEERSLRELYLRSFDILLKNSNPWSIMSTYGKLNGIYTASNGELLTGILRDEWGYDGAVMTDWGQKGSFFGAVRAQNDLVMPMASVDSLVEACRKGEVSEAQIDVCVKNVLNLVLKTRRFAEYKANNYQPNSQEKPVQPDSAAAAALSRQAAADGMVLLKNDGPALPLKTGDSVALFGDNQRNPVKGGYGSGNVFSKDTVSLQMGFDNASIPLNSSLRALYDSASGEIAVTEQQAAAAAASSAIAVVAFGRTSAEGQELPLQKGGYYLTDAEVSLLSVVSEAFHAQNKKVAVVLNTGNLLDMSAINSLSDAVLLSWLPGQETGDAIVDVLSGKVNPSGKLTVTAAKSYEDYPNSRDYPGQGADVQYNDGLYVGYRYFRSFEKEVDYAFGYGLSYTRFSYGDVTLSKNSYDGSLTASVTVTNTGAAAGREVVQFYVDIPEVRLEQPVAQLKGFGKTGLLQPGQTQTITVTLDDETLKSYDTQNARWILEPGGYTVMAGASCLDIRSAAPFTLDRERVVAQVENRAEPETPIDTLSRHDEVTVLTHTGTDGQEAAGLRVKLPEEIDPASLPGAQIAVTFTIGGKELSRQAAGLNSDGRFLTITLDQAAALYQDGLRQELRVCAAGTVRGLSGCVMDIPDTSQRVPVLSDSALDQMRRYTYRSPDGVKLSARAYVPAPPASALELTNKVPLAVVLGGPSGDDNMAQIASNGLAASVIQNRGQGGIPDAAVLAPQLPEGERWDSPAMQRRLFYLIKRFLSDNAHLNPYRVAVIGDEQGSLGAAALAKANPGLLAGLLVTAEAAGTDIASRGYEKEITAADLNWLFGCEGFGFYISSTTPNEILAKDYISAAGNTLEYSSLTKGYAVGNMLPNGVMNYKIIVQEDGTYDFRFHVATATGGIGDAFQLLVDGNRAGATYVPASSGWDRWNRTNIEGVKLTAGKHDIQIYANTGSWNMERIRITNRNAVQGNEVYQGSSTFISCLYNSMTYGMPMETTQEGQGYSFAWVNAGYFVKYLINVKDEGYYNISNRVTSENGVAGGLEVRVDGTSKGTLDIPKTGSWSLQRNATLNGVYLTAGVHEVEFITKSGGFNVGDLLITDPDLEQTPYLPASAMLSRGQSSGSWKEEQIQLTGAEYPAAGAALLSSNGGELVLAFPSGVRGVSVKMARLGTDGGAAAADEAYRFAWSEDGAEYTELPTDAAAHLYRDFSGYFSGTVPLKGLPENARYLKITASPEAATAPAIGGLYVDTDPVRNAVELIDGIGQVTIQSGKKIKTAQSAYEGLTREQRLQVENAGVLRQAADSYRQQKLGDFNDDNRINALDVSAMKESIFIAAQPGEYGDLNGDGKLDVLDLVLVKRKIAGR